MRHASTPLLAAAAALSAHSVFAHPGHGMDGIPHWHATDLVGLLVIGVIASAACWFTRDR